ncbi:anti-sigma factor [Foetidibacter luteolus]|uniref:anti-sigma factor n=1 Tax=Foetidibacter luteolus TaxID=2608880 RepID=UPI00129BB0D2|nr:anti-sigma factor [Foetidibacter luteolus]
MDIKAYIESGIIESYVLELASPEEAAELEQLMQQHAQVRQAVDAFSASLEQNALNSAVAPPPALKETVMAALMQQANNQPTAAAPFPLRELKSNTLPGAAVVRSAFWKYMAAASIVLLIGSAALNVYFYNGYKTAYTKYQALLSTQNTMQASMDVYKAKMDDMDESIKVMNDPATRMIKMPGVAGHENSLAQVYWNQSSKNVYLSTGNLPATPAGKQYQLWAIVNGQPVNAGMVDDCAGLCKMLTIPNAQAFAITLEKAGGNAAPSMDQMFVLGKV